MTRWRGPPTALCIENKINPHTDHRADTELPVLVQQFTRAFLALFSGIS